MLEELTERLRQGVDLSRAEAEAALQSILEPDSKDDAIAAFLTALHEKGESPREIAGFAAVMRRRSVPVKSKTSQLVDTAGTGGGKESFNVSTTALFVIAGAGQAVAKHGNRAVTSRCGSADLLTALGVNVTASPTTAVRCLDEHGVAFFFAPRFHPAMHRVAGIRRRLGHRTIFNLLGPLTNPAAAPHQLIGVYSADLTEKVAQALALLGTGKAWVVHSRDGMDEISHRAPTRVSEVEGSTVRSFDLEPRDHGFDAASDSLHRGGLPQENAEVCLGILENRIHGANRDIVVLNAAAALHIAGAGSFADMLERASDSISCGAALAKLDLLRDSYAGTGS